MRSSDTAGREMTRRQCFFSEMSYLKRKQTCGLLSLKEVLSRGMDNHLVCDVEYVSPPRGLGKP